MKKVLSVILVLVLFMSQGFCSAPKRPFPQSSQAINKTWVSNSAQTPGVGYWEYTVRSGEKIVDSFEEWDENFYKTYDDSDVGYIEGHITGEVVEWGYSEETPDNGNNYQPVSASEHTGYGMIIYALLDGYGGEIDCKERFDSLARLYYQLKRENNLMCWAVPKVNWDTFKEQKIQSVIVK